MLISRLPQKKNNQQLTLCSIQILTGFGTDGFNKPVAISFEQILYVFIVMLILNTVQSPRDIQL